MPIHHLTQQFLRSFTNVLAAVAQYGTFLTFGAALAIDTGMNRGVDPTSFGCILVSVNMIALGVAVVGGVKRHSHEVEIQNKQNARRSRGKIETAIGYVPELCLASPSECL
jgi:uncharacterized protein (DUF362 family)